MQAQKRIHIEQANIKTATIEIKALMINSRQLTLSVFRQIPEEELIDEETLQLRGIPWGRVNYWWGDLSGDHHILWQKDQELRRSVVKRARYDKELKRWAELFTGDSQELFNEFHFIHPNSDYGDKTIGTDSAARLVSKGEGIAIRWKFAAGASFDMKTQLPPWPTFEIYPDPSKPANAADRQVIENREAIIRENKNKLHSYYWHCARMIKNHLDQRYQASCEEIKQYNNLINELGSLDQIFIAV